MPRPGVVNNPTGKGGFGPGNNGWTVAGPSRSAGRRMIDALAKAAMAHDGTLLDQIAESIVGRAVAGDNWAIEFMWNRIVGPVKAQQPDTPDGDARTRALEEKFVALLEGMAARREDEALQ